VFYDPAGAHPDNGYSTIRRLSELLKV
jgi:hypothetical protein